MIFALGGYSLQSAAGASLKNVQYRSVSSAFVIAGGMKGYQSIDLSTVTALPYFKVGSMLKQANVSYIVASVDDFNHDGLQDTIVANPLESRCQVFLGTSHQSFSFDSFKSQQPSFLIVGASSNEYFGWSIAALGDLNHDGTNEVMISALNSKTVYVLYGSESFPQLFNVTKMTAMDGFRIIGGKLHQDFGIAVAAGGDFNNDGFEDYVISARLANSQIGLAGVIYVIYGRSAIHEDLRMDALNSSDYFSVTAAWNLFAGFSIDGLGDFNGDGFADIIIGSVPYAGGYVTQRSYVVYGRKSGNSTLSQLNLETMREGDDGFTIIGGGFMVAGPGDVNGDGMPDILVSSYYDWQQDSNSYLLQFPGRITSSPSSFPTSTPSLSPTIFFFPTNRPSLSPRPTQTIPSQSPDSSFPPTSYQSTVPSISSTVKVQKSLKPTFNKPSLSPTRSPSIKPTISLRQPTKTNSPSFKPSYLPSIKPSTIKPQSVNASSSPFPVTLITVNGSYTQTGGNVVYQINAKGSVVIQGGKGKEGKSIYVIEAVNINSLIISFFDPTDDVLDFRQDSYVTGLQDVSYSTNPLTLILPPYQQTIVMKNLNTINDLTDDNYYFSSTSSSSSSSSSKKGSKAQFTPTEMGTMVGFGALVILSIFFGQMSFKRTSYDHNNKVNAATKILRRLSAVLKVQSPLNSHQIKFASEGGDDQDSSSSEPSSLPSIKSSRRLSILYEVPIEESDVDSKSSTFDSLSSSSSLDSKRFLDLFPTSNEYDLSGDSDTMDSFSSEEEEDGKFTLLSQQTSSSEDPSLNTASQSRSWCSGISRTRSDCGDALV